MRKVLSMAFLVSLSSFSTAAFAAEPGAVAGAALGAVGGEVAGALVFGAVGLGVGSSMCRPDAMECWAPLLGAGFGGAAGGVGGGIGGAALGAKIGGGRPGPAAAGAAIGAGVGVGLFIGSLVVFEEVTPGVVMLFASVPAGAAIGAALDHGGPRGDRRSVQVSLAPAFGPRLKGATVFVTF